MNKREKMRIKWRFNMSKILIIFALILSLSCSISLEDTNTGCNIDFENIEHLYAWVAENWNYKSDISNSWQSPDISYQTMTGDCEDQVILFLFLCYEQFNYNGRLVVETDYKNVYPKIRGHAIAEVNSKKYFHLQKNKYEIEFYDLYHIRYILKNNY
jgi:hypothetical protein